MPGNKAKHYFLPHRQIMFGKISVFDDRGMNPAQVSRGVDDGYFHSDPGLVHTHHHIDDAVG